MDNVGIVRLGDSYTARKRRSEKNISFAEKSNGFSITILNKKFCIDTTDGVQVIDVTDHIQETLAILGVWTGLLSLQSLHTTTGLFINERQEALLKDLEEMLELLVPSEKGWRHNDPGLSDCERRNAHAHLRAILLGHTLSLQVQEGHILLGQWQRILFAEFDGPRKRTVQIQFVGAIRVKNREFRARESRSPVD